LEDLTNLETLEEELAHSDRLASIGRLAAGVAHEIGNPVTGIASLAQNLRGEKDPAIIEQSVHEILEQTQRITVIVRSLMNFSRSGGTHKPYQPFPLVEIADEAIRLVKLTPHGHQVEYRNSSPDGLKVCGDRQKLLQVLLNLLTNASDASEPGAQVELLGIQLDQGVQVEIIDRGKGIPENIQELIFEPFYTTKPPGEGTGLGLAMAHKIITDHNGTIEIDSTPGVGTRVTIYLPDNAGDKPK
jgi:signal transduction histidine kinase